MPSTTKIRLFCGRDCDGMIRKLDDATFKNKAVSSLEIRETALEDEVIDSIVDLLSKGSVTTIHLEDCSARLNLPVVRLVEALGKCRDVRLSENTFLSRFFLDSLLESATQLKSLRIRDHLLVEQVEALSRGLASNKILHTLDLSRSRIDDFSVLAEGLRGGCAKKLKLRSIGLRDCHLTTLMAALESSLSCPHDKAAQPSSSSSSSSLESLDLSFNRLRNLTCIGEFLKHKDCHLKDLHIGYQNLWQPIGSGGTHICVSEIAKALVTNKSLVSLGLPRNELTDADALGLASALSNNSTLEILDLRENRIATGGVMALAETALSSRGLRRMNLSGNPFGTRASLALLEAASKNFCLLFLGDNGDENDDGGINRKIRYETALNRGGRQLLRLDDTHLSPSSPSCPPPALWPLVLEKQASRRDRERIDDNHPMVHSVVGESMRTDVLYYLLRSSPTTFFSSSSPPPSCQIIRSSDEMDAG